MHNKLEFTVFTRRLCPLSDWRVVACIVSVDDAICFREILTERLDDRFDEVKLEDANSNLIFTYPK